MDDSAIICDELIDTYAEDKSNNKPRSNNKKKQILIKRKQLVKHKSFMFCLHFY